MGLAVEVEISRRVLRFQGIFMLCYVCSFPWGLAGEVEIPVISEGILRYPGGFKVVYSSLGGLAVKVEIPRWSFEIPQWFRRLFGDYKIPRGYFYLTSPYNSPWGPCDQRLRIKGITPWFSKPCFFYFPPLQPTVFRKGIVQPSPRLRIKSPPPIP